MSYYSTIWCGGEEESTNQTRKRMRESRCANAHPFSCLLDMVHFSALSLGMVHHMPVIDLKLGLVSVSEKSVIEVVSGRTAYVFPISGISS